MEIVTPVASDGSSAPLARGSLNVFGTNIITAEINRHYRERLRRPVKAKLVSITLKRLQRQGELRQVRAGRPHHEALYARMEGKS